MSDNDSKGGKNSSKSGGKRNSSIDLATEKASLVICQTFSSGNTQLVTIVGKEDLKRLKSAIEEALDETPEPVRRSLKGWIEWQNEVRSVEDRDTILRIF